jgi:hypothetical protein
VILLPFFFFFFEKIKYRWIKAFIHQHPKNTPKRKIDLPQTQIEKTITKARNTSLKQNKLQPQQNRSNKQQYPRYKPRTNIPRIEHNKLQKSAQHTTTERTNKGMQVSSKQTLSYEWDFWIAL